MLAWADQKCFGYGFSTGSFKNSAWQNGQAFCALADSFKSGVYARHFDRNQGLTSPEDALKEAFAVLESKGITRLLDVGDREYWDPLSLSAYIDLMMKAEKK